MKTTGIRFEEVRSSLILVHTVETHKPTLKNRVLGSHIVLQNTVIRLVGVRSSLIVIHTVEIPKSTL